MCKGPTGKGGRRDFRNAHLRILGLFVLGVSLCLVSPGATAQTEAAAPGKGLLYWADASGVQRANVDGSNVVSLVRTGSQAWGIDLDLVNGHIYLTDVAGVLRAGLDGGKATRLVASTVSGIGNVDVDPARGRFYWSDRLAINSRNLDGSFPKEGAILKIPSVFSFTLDPTKNHIYWTQAGTGLTRTDLLGLNPVNLFSGPHFTFDVVLDKANGRVYWGNQDADTIQSANLDGSDVVTVVTKAGVPRGIALDVPNNHIYWVAGRVGAIRRANLDGTNVVDLVTHLNTPGFLVIDPPSAVNQPPVADAGADQSVHPGDTAFLSGLNSSDDNTDSKNLLYHWFIGSAPHGSAAVLVGSETPVPQLQTDLPGTYAVHMVVKDEGNLKSEPDEVLVSTDNLAPTALAVADNVLVPIGTLVSLDGTGSTDPEGDALTYFWTFGKPVGSAAALDDIGSPTPTFTPDLAGTYKAALTVSDLLGDGPPSTVEVMAVTAEELATLNIVSASTTVSELSADAVTTGGNQNAFQNFLQQAATAIAAGDTDAAIKKLETAISRTDGCVLRGAPDGNGPGRDWVTNCAAQLELYALLTEALNAITPTP